MTSIHNVENARSNNSNVNPPTRKRSSVLIEEDFEQIVQQYIERKSMQEVMLLLPVDKSFISIQLNSLNQLRADQYDYPLSPPPSPSSIPSEEDDKLPYKKRCSWFDLSNKLDYNNDEENIQSLQRHK